MDKVIVTAFVAGALLMAGAPKANAAPCMTVTITGALGVCNVPRWRADRRRLPQAAQDSGFKRRVVVAKDLANLRLPAK